MVFGLLSTDSDAIWDLNMLTGTPGVVTSLFNSPCRRASNAAAGRSVLLNARTAGGLAQEDIPPVRAFASEPENLQVEFLVCY